MAMIYAIVVKVLDKQHRITSRARSYACQLDTESKMGDRVSDRPNV